MQMVLKIVLRLPGWVIVGRDYRRMDRCLVWIWIQRQVRV